MYTCIVTHTGKGGEGRELNQREGDRGNRGEYRSQSWAENSNMTEFTQEIGSSLWTPAAKSLSRSIFLDDDILHWPKRQMHKINASYFKPVLFVKYIVTVLKSLNLTAVLISLLQIWEVLYLLAGHHTHWVPPLRQPGMWRYIWSTNIPTILVP